jgi:hypothetical protein
MFSMLSAHPDQVLELARQHQADLRQGMARLNGNDGAEVRALLFLRGLWSRLSFRPRPRVEDAIWPRLSDYPYR